MRVAHDGWCTALADQGVTALLCSAHESEAKRITDVLCSAHESEATPLILASTNSVVLRGVGGGTGDLA